mmetsp:Transcript_27327/g.20459  ORF Transcript_27327/g.20459 Transcript_27327/m.20459 type:complete len:310 (+) Transcript_27327:68-997(+)
MMLENVKNKPENQIKFMLKFLEDQYGTRATQGNRADLEFLRHEAKRLEILLKEAEEKKKDGGSVDNAADDRGSEHETDQEDEDEDYVEILPEKINNKYKKGPRGSVSAEAFGVYNKKEDFKAREVAKSADVCEKIVARLNMTFMFQALDESEKDIVVKAMEERRVVPGEFVIKQGEEGDNLYVVESGILSCEKTFPGNQSPTFLKKFQPGDSFGELALLYNAPRAASIFADTDAILWSLDRATFTHIVKDAASRKREKYEEFLARVPLLSTMDNYERSKLSDALKEHHFQAGEFIIKEGEEGNVFFMIQ